MAGDESAVSCHWAVSARRRRGLCPRGSAFARVGPGVTASVDVVQEHATAAAILILIDLAAREPPLEDVQRIQASLERPVRATAESPIAVLMLALAPVASGRVLVFVFVPVFMSVFAPVVVSVTRVRVITRAAVTTTLRARADADDGRHQRRQRDRPSLRPNLDVSTFFARHRDLLDDH